jgi:DNA-directed RNA polymerase subunit beta'
VLNTLDLTALSNALREEIQESAWGTCRQKKLIKRFQIVEALRHSGSHPAWMVLDVLPVLSPDLRPLVHLSGGRFAASDLNRL